jgi:uncharacterized protein with von Willebrand factor type A (vWA) domain
MTVDDRPVEVTHLTLDVPAVAAAFTRALHDAGLPVSGEHAARFARALTVTRPLTRRRLYFTARCVLAAEVAQFAAFDAVFAAAFGAGTAPSMDEPIGAEQPRAVPPVDEPPPVRDPALGPAGADDRDAPWDLVSSESSEPSPEEPAARPLALMAAGEERLLDRRFDALTPEELAELNRLIARLALAPPLRRTRRARRDRHGERIDLRRTLRDSRRTAGDPIRLARRRRTVVRRRLVLLCDISGSMEPYARVYLQFLACGGRCGRGAEAFAFATRLTRLTRALRSRNPELAIARAAATAPDWSSGTRIGDALKAFNDRHGRRGMARGAVIVIISDGWERGDPALVALEMERLARLAHRIVWVNPRVAASGFAPRAGGMRAALEHCDALLSGHTLRALHEVVDAIGAEHPRGADRGLPVWLGSPAAGELGEREESWPSATPMAGSSVAMPSGYGPSRGRTTPGWGAG